MELVEALELCPGRFHFVCHRPSQSRDVLGHHDGSCRLPLRGMRHLAVWVIYKTLAQGEPVAGYPSLMVAIMFLGGIQMTIGVLGEYLSRMSD